jgi:hypothetical protein
MIEFFIAAAAAFALCWVWVGGYLADFLIWIISKLTPDTSNERNLAYIVAGIFLVIGIIVAAVQSQSSGASIAGAMGGAIAGVGAYIAVRLPSKIRVKRENKAIKTGALPQAPQPVQASALVASGQARAAVRTDYNGTRNDMDSGPFCGQCGTKMRPTARFCKNCGAPASRELPQKQTFATQKKEAVMEKAPNRKRGITFIVLGIVVFVICSIVQAIGGSNMFTDRYYPPDNLILDLLMQITWWPGWLATIGCLLYGGSQALFAKK